MLSESGIHTLLALRPTIAESDPNWFYSSLAQSAAGIVGLFGGILATRIQTQNDLAAGQRKRSTAALLRLKADIDELRTALLQYLDHSPGQLQLFRDAIASSKPSIHVAAWYHPTWHDTTTTDRTANADELLKEERRAQHTTLVETLMVDLLTKQTATAIEVLVRALQPLLPAEGDTTLNKWLTGISASAQEAARQLEILGRKTELKVWVGFACCLLIIAGAGLVAPLFCLSVDSTWLRDVSGGSFAVGILMLFAFMASQLVELRTHGVYKVLLPPSHED